MSKLRLISYTITIIAINTLVLTWCFVRVSCARPILQQLLMWMELSCNLAAAVDADVGFCSFVWLVIKAMTHWRREMGGRRPICSNHVWSEVNDFQLCWWSEHVDGFKLMPLLVATWFRYWNWWFIFFCFSRLPLLRLQLWKGRGGVGGRLGVGGEKWK